MSSTETVLETEEMFSEVQRDNRHGRAWVPVEEMQHTGRSLFNKQQGLESPLRRDWSEECALVTFKALVVLKTWSDKALPKWLILTKLI